MKLSVKQLRSIISEELAAQAPPDAPLGQWAWPAERELSVDEPDTQLEKDLFVALKGWLLDNKLIPAEKVLLLKQMLNNGYYKEVLHVPQDVTEVYRGIKVSYAKLKSIIGSEPESFSSLCKELVYKPNRQLSSWSKNRKIARNFAETHVKETFGLIFTADVNVNDMLDIAGLYQLYSFSEMDYESEVLAFGDVKVKRVCYAEAEYIDANVNILLDLLNDKYLS